MNLQAVEQSRPVYTRSSSLEYQYAFDLCAARAYAAAGSVALVASSAFYSAEIGRRMTGCTLVPTSPAAGPVDGLASLNGDRIQSIPLAGWNREAGTVVWAEPEPEGSDAVLGAIGRNLSAGGSLYAVSSSGLARALPEWKQDAAPGGRRPLGPRRTLALLRAATFVIEEMYGFHGPASVAWSYLSRAAAGIGRADLADRCHFQMRATYVVSGWLSLLAPVCVIVAHCGGIRR